MKDLMTGRLRSAGRAMAAAARRPAGRAGALGAVLALVAAVAAVAAPPAMAATSAPHAVRAPAAPKSSRRFTVTNLSGYTLKLEMVGGDNNFEGRPPDGSTISPGYSQAWEIKLKVFDSQTDTATYSVLDGNHLLGYFHATMLLDGWGHLAASCQATTGTCTHTSNSNTFLSAPTTNTIDNRAEQSDLLDRYCAGAPNFSCTFDPVSKQFTWGAPHQSGPAIANETSSDISQKIVVTEKVTSSENVELNKNAKVTVGKAVEAGISKKYGQTQADERTYVTDTTIPIKAHTKVWPEVEDPLIVYTGTFLIRLGNTTWDLENVVVSYPDPDGFPTIHWKEAPI